MVDRDARPARTRCASRRRAAAVRSRPRRSRRRSPGPGSRPARPRSRLTSSAADWHQSTSRVCPPVLWTVNARCRNSAPASAVPAVGKRHAEGWPLPSGRSSVAPAQAAVGPLLERLVQRERRARQQLGVLVEQQRVASPRAAQQLGVVERLAAPFVERDHLVHGGVGPRGLGGAVARAVVEHEHLGRERQVRPLARDRVQPAQQQLALGGVHDAVRQLDLDHPHTYCPVRARPRRRPLGLHAAVRPRPVPRAGGRGAEVELFTSRFAYGPVAPAEGYRRRELFYRQRASRPAPARSGCAKLAEHVPDMLATAAPRGRRTSCTSVALRAAPRRSAAPAPAAQIAPPRRRRLWGVTRSRPALVLTAHDVLPREPRPGQLAAQRRLYERFDAIVVHSEHGRARLTGELGVDPARVHVIPHGVFAHLADVPAAAGSVSDRRSPVVLCFGLMRPYKGIDVLLDAWREIEDAELWIAGMPRMDISHLRALAPPNVRFVPRFITDARAARLFPARRPGRAALSRDRPVGGAVHGARVRQAAAAERRRRISRGGRDRRRADRSRRGIPQRWARRCGSCSATRPRWRRWPPAAGGGGGKVFVGCDRQADTGALPLAGLTRAGLPDLEDTDDKDGDR